MSQAKLVGAEQLLNAANDLGSQYAAGVAALSGGGAVAVWDDSTTLSYQISFRLMSPKAPTGSEVDVANGSDIDGSVAALANGGFVVSWLDTQGLGSIWEQQYDASGAPVGAAREAIQGYTATAGNGVTYTIHLTQQSVAVLADGTIIAPYSYNSSGSDGSFNTTTGLNVSNGDGVFAAVQNNGTGDSHVVGLPNSQNFVWAWQSGSGQVDAAIISETGNYVVDSFALSQHPGDDNSGPAIALLPSGQFVAVWDDATTGAVEYRIFNADGSAASAEGTAGASASPPGQPSVASLGNGQFAIAWTQTVGGVSAIVERLVNGDGSPASPIFKVNTSSANSASGEIDPALAGLGGGEALTIWSDDSHQAQGQNGDANGYAVKSQLVQFAAADDFNGDGRSDILFLNPNGQVAQWQMNGAAVTGGGVFATLSAGYTISGVGDFNGDGDADLLTSTAGGALAVVDLEGTQTIGGGPIGALGAGWSVAGVGDFNADGMADVLFQNSSGALGMWEMNNTQVIGGGIFASLGAGSGWSVAGTGDFNGDGRSDILLQNGNGQIALWEMNGVTVIGGGVVGSLGAGSGWSVAGVGDFNGDGYADILFENVNGALAMWEMNGATVAGGGIFQSLGASSGWSVAAVGDDNGDGMADILLHNTSGADQIWAMNGMNVIGGGAIPAIGAPWIIQHG